MIPVLVGMTLFAISCYFEVKKRNKRIKEYKEFADGIGSKRKNLFD